MSTAQMSCMYVAIATWFVTISVISPSCFRSKSLSHTDCHKTTYALVEFRQVLRLGEPQTAMNMQPNKLRIVLT